MYGKTIEMFLVDGTADGVVTAELSNWNGKAIRLPRTEVEGCQRDDVQGVGIYFLFCRGSGAEGGGFVPAQDFTVIAGSRTSDHVVESLKTREKSYWRLRNRLIENGVIEGASSRRTTSLPPHRLHMAEATLDPHAGSTQIVDLRYPRSSAEGKLAQVVDAYVYLVLVRAPANAEAAPLEGAGAIGTLIERGLIGQAERQECLACGRSSKADSKVFAAAGIAALATTREQGQILFRGDMREGEKEAA